MKHYALSLACALTFISVTTFTASAPKQLFSLTIAAPKEPLKAGAEFHLTVTVTNTSNSPISFVTSPGPIPDDGLLYEIHVRDQHGRSAPQSPYVRNRDTHVPVHYGSRLARTLKPGESFVDQVIVTEFYDLSSPGEYSITVARSMPARQNLGNGSVTSNAVTITVTQ